MDYFEKLVFNYADGFQDEIKVFETAANHGEVVAQLGLAQYYERKNGQDFQHNDINRAGFWYLKAAEQRNPVAVRRVVSMYTHGWGGVQQNSGKAAEWQRIALSLPEDSIQCLWR